MTGLLDVDEQIEPLLRAPARPKKNNVGDLTLPVPRQRAERIVAAAPEVVVKVTGHARGAKHLRRLMQYITRGGELTAENDVDEVINGKEAVAAFANDWNATSGRRGERTRDTVNIVVSMPAATDPDAVLVAARALAKQEFAGNHEYALVLHTFDTDPSPTPSPNPHVHIVVKSLGHDGRRLNPRKADLQRWRDVFAERLREQGIEAESTPRRTRGVVKKAVRQPLHHLQQREPRTQRLESTVREMAAEVLNPAALSERPWEQAIRQQQTLVRGQWLDAARALECSVKSEDRELSARIRQFVANMPAIKTRREEIAEQLREQLAERLPAARDPRRRPPSDIER